MTETPSSMNPIICVTEFDEHTLEAAKVAAAFGRRLGERVVLVRSVDEREQFPYNLRVRLMQHDFRRLADEAHRLRQVGFDFEERVVCGMPEEGISGLAWKSGACLVVVGAAPTATVEHWALGCMAEEISDTSLVPILAVRSAAVFEEWLEGDARLKVFMAVDPSARPDAMLNRIDELCQMGACTIQASFVTYQEKRVPSAKVLSPVSGTRLASSDLELRDAMDHALAARDITVCELNSGRDATASVVARANDMGADLLVITSHPGSDLTLLPHPALAHGILRRAPMNVLCVPEPDIEPPHPISNVRHQTNAGFPDREPGSSIRRGHNGDSR